MDWLTVAFVGWFGPRGLASVAFALITLEDLHDVPGPVQSVVGTIGLTVLTERARPRAKRTPSSR